jgi:hypothetical protein
MHDEIPPMERMQVVFRKTRCRARRVRMRDFLMALIFMAMVMAPCVAALTSKNDKKGWR